MPLFYLKYTINENARSDCMTYFGGMTPDDDVKDMGKDIQLLGRWSTVGESSGFCICQAKNAKVLNSWLLNWSTMATIECFPVVDDNAARKIILGNEPSFMFDYTNVGNEAKSDESLYFIEYKFHPEKRQQGFEAFSQMTQEQDVCDAGSNTCYGRWHNLGTGSGVAICSSKSEVDLYTWAFHWTSMCDCVVRPVVSDKDCRDNIKSKPDFQVKYQGLMDKMKGVKKSWWR
jgi:hypothetical protein